jgi:DNA-binding NarL/FixJ family response regulator
MVSFARSADSVVMQKESKLTVFLVDDSAPIRERLKELLAQNPAVQVVGEAEKAATAIRGILATRPKFVVLDYRLQEGTGLDVLRAVAGLVRETTFIVLTNHFNAQVRAACTAAGAHYFLDKSSQFDRLNAIIAAFNVSRG